MKTQIILGAVLVLLSMIVYIKCAMADNPELVVIQTTLASFTPELLLEKSPIVISDRVIDVNELIASSFRYMHASAKTITVTLDNQVKNKYKYIVLHSPAQGCSVQLVHPLSASMTTQIILHPHTVLVIPMSYVYTVHDALPEAAIGMHTVLSVFT